jgi:hypothetical protein
MNSPPTNLHVIVGEDLARAIALKSFVEHKTISQVVEEALAKCLNP